MEILLEPVPRSANEIPCRPVTFAPDAGFQAPGLGSLFQNQAFLFVRAASLLRHSPAPYPIEAQFEMSLRSSKNKAPPEGWSLVFWLTCK